MGGMLIGLNGVDHVSEVIWTDSTILKTPKLPEANGLINLI